MLRAGADTAEPGLLRVLRAGAGSGAGSDTAGPGFRAGAGPVQSTDRTSPGRSRPVGGTGSGCPIGAPGGGNRLDSVHNPLVTTPPVQEEFEVEPSRVGPSEAGAHKADQVVASLPASQVDFPPLRRSSRVKTRPDIYQAGT